MTHAMTLDEAARTLAEAIAHARGPVLVLTGAGVSVASGIPTFRGNDPGAVWSQDVTEMATYGFFRRDPVRSWQWYRQRFARASTSQPNAAHIAIAGLERWHSDRGRDFLLVTQNIDTLHDQAGSTRMVKVHGSADRVRCANDACLSSATATLAYADQDFSAFERSGGVDDIPHCAQCGDLLRPHVLWFDELYSSHDDYAWPKVMEICDEMRLVIAVGTSFSVGVTELVRQSAHRRDVPMFVVDPSDAGPGARTLCLHVRQKAEALLPLTLDTLQG